MSAPAFTPGPWQAKHDYTVEGATTIIANVDGEIHGDDTMTYTYDHIATCEDEFGDRLPNAQANARLIAAAPELYEALELALDLIGERGGLNSPTGRIRSTGRAALAKARGDQ